MRRFHIVLGSRLDAEKTRSQSAAGECPRHFMIELTDRLGGKIHEPEVQIAKFKPDVVSRLLGADAAIAQLAQKVALEARDEDVIFCQGELVALPLAGALVKQKKAAKIVSFAHNLKRPRIKAVSMLTPAFKRVDQFLALSETMRASGHPHIEKYYEQIDDRFFTQGVPGTNYRKERPLIIAVGLERRDYKTLAEATAHKPVDVAISGFSRDAKVLAETFPEELPANMTRKFYEWAELVDLYRSADLVVVPVQENPYAAGVTSILEAMAVGKPVIATRTEGLKGVIADEAAVDWVDPGNPVALWLRIETLLQNDQARSDLAARGAEIFKAHHRKDDRLEEIAEKLRTL